MPMVLLSRLVPRNTTPLRRAALYRMASTGSVAKKHEFVVILPDHEGVLDERMKIRPTHLEGLTPKIGNFWVMGGAFMHEVPAEGEAPQVRGSIMVAVAESKEQILEQIKADPYCKAGVWDMDKVQIYPFRPVFREALEK